MRRWAALGALFVLGFSVGEAAVGNVLRGDLRTPEPMAFDGLLVIPPTPMGGVASLAIHPGAQPEGQVLLRADRAIFDLYSTSRLPSLVGPHAQTNVRGLEPVEELKTNPTDLTDAILTLHFVRETPQILVQNDFDVVPSGHGNASASQCTITDPTVASAFEFPADPKRETSTDVETRSADRRELRADCEVDAFAYKDARLVRIYGFDVKVVGRNEQGGLEEKVFQTGTLETTERGVPERVTQILDIKYKSRPMRFEAPFAAHVQLYSPEFFAIGELGLGPSTGIVEWGPVLRQGPIEPFMANGAVRLAWGPQESVVIDGSTLNEPTLAAPASTSVRAMAPGAVATAAVIAAIGLLALAASGLWSLFTKLAPDRLLDHPRRSRILEYVRNDPGVGTNALARSLGLRWAIAVYHVTTLQRGGHLTVRRIGGRTALFPANTGFRGREERVAILRRDTPKRLFEVLHQRPGLDQEALAGTLGLTQARISQALKMMESCGLVRAERVGRRRQYHAVPEGAVSA